MSKNAERLGFDPKSKLRVCFDFFAHEIATNLRVLGPCDRLRATVLAVIRVDPRLEVLPKRMMLGAVVLLIQDLHRSIYVAVVSRSFVSRRASVTAYEYENSNLNTGYLMNVESARSMEQACARLVLLARGLKEHKVQANRVSCYRQHVPNRNSSVYRTRYGYGNTVSFHPQPFRFVFFPAVLRNHSRVNNLT